MSLIYPASKSEYESLDTQGIRTNYLNDQLFEKGVIQWFAYETDRVMVGSACPGDTDLTLCPIEDLKADFFCQRRELGILNIGAPGKITVDAQAYELGRLECLYIGRGSKDVTFHAAQTGMPEFYLVSYPAHASHPTCKSTAEQANIVNLGSGETANERTIYQYIHEGGIQSCQLVMGYTELAPGSVWNTMPAHTHERRSEVYLYFDVPASNAVFHFMGDPQATRHMVVKNKEAIISPAWSIHSGCGTSNYRFIWAMGGENQSFNDMDGCAIDQLL